MTSLLVGGIVFMFCAIAAILLRWGNERCYGSSPVSTVTFIAILFTSGLDVGLIMFPLTEFAGYSDIQRHPEYAFSNPLTIEFGFWGFLIWLIYFLPCFYFCKLEPKLGFFKIPVIKWLNNMIIIATSAFTAHLLLSNLNWYLPNQATPDGISWPFVAIVFVTIACAVYSSSRLKYVRTISITTAVLFILLLCTMLVWALSLNDQNLLVFTNSLMQLSDYFVELHQFVVPLNEYHAFYLFWWFGWSLMIGQFTARFVGGQKTWQVLLNMLIWPSIPIALWFSVLYMYHLEGIKTQGLINALMVFVGVTFVINSLDSMVRLYSDNLNLTRHRLGSVNYWITHTVILCSLVFLFNLDFVRMQWIGALVIVLMFACFAYFLQQQIGVQMRKDVAFRPIKRLFS